ncbi:MAG: endonuclease MutS2 [Pseudomonadota bacterium]
MNEHTLRVLEFNKILSFLKGFATSDVGKALCESLRPLRDIKEIEILLDEVGELKEVLQIYGDIPIGGIRDVGESVLRTRVEGSILDPLEFLDILSTLKATHQLKRFFEKLEDHKYPVLRKIGNGFISLLDVQLRIEESVGVRGDVLDSASLELREIRRKIKKLKIKIQNSLEDLLAQDSLQPFFQEKIITVRNSRYVIPVKSDFKGNIQGIIHDHSHSKATYFIEPIFTIELNNELGLLFKEEKNEELRVLRNLSNNIRVNAQEILSNLRLLGKVDLTYAKAKYSIELDGKRPVLDGEGRVNLIRAYHPLLLSLKNGYGNGGRPIDSNTDVIPIDIHFDKGYNTLIITGANTGGKTVALKTVGILTLMVQAGMHIPVADGSVAGIFDSIFADIGDEQDIQQNLSTFSSHISQIIEILHEAAESSLILLDEIGVGTDPDEGAALAMALLDYLREKGSSIIATTHLSLLKAYAYLHEDAINVSVDFDPETMEPRYRLIYGIPGESNALVIAERLGVPREILDRAVGFIEDSDSRTLGLMRSLESSQREILEEKKEIKRLKDITMVCQKQVESMVEEIREKKDKILFETEAKARTLLRKAEGEVREIVKDLKNKDECSVRGVNERLHDLKEEIDLLKPIRRRKGRPPLNPKIGDVVRICPLNKEGVIVNTQDGSDRIEALIGNLKVKVPLNDLEEVSRDTIVRDLEIKGEVPPTTPITGVTSRINVVGMRVDDALPLVDKAIDNAILSGTVRLDIVHGIGTGRLRNAIREYLGTHSFVTNFGSADLSHGGSGVTLVEIKA